MIAEKEFQLLLNHARSRVESALDPSIMFVENKELKTLLVPHKGFYIGIEDSSGEEILREGFLKEDLRSILESAEITIENTVRKLKHNSVALTKIQTSTFYLTIVYDLSYIQNPLHWDENKDGIYLQWGQDYKALYLPYQVKKMSIPKIEIMDRLCCWEAGLAASLWRKPEGLCFRIICQTFPEI